MNFFAVGSQFISISSIDDPEKIANTVVWFTLSER